MSTLIANAINSNGTLYINNVSSGDIDIAGGDGTIYVSNVSSDTTITSTLATGTAPLVVASTTNVANLNASSLSGATFASPGIIGSGTPSSATFTETIVNGINITPITGEIPQTSFSPVNNQVLAANVTGLYFNPATTRSFRAIVHVDIQATANLVAQFVIRGILKRNNTWHFFPEQIGDPVGFSFSITDLGQVQYTSTNISGHTSTIIKFICKEVTNV